MRRAFSAPESGAAGTFETGTSLPALKSDMFVASVANKVATKIKGFRP